MSKQKLVLVGNGMAGIRAIEEILAINSTSYDITVFGAEPHCNYNRILLSPVLAGEQTVQDIILNDRAWYKENQITLHTGKKITQIDRKNKIVIAEDGTSASYDILILATGSNPFILPVEGNDLNGVIGFRNIEDVDVMVETAKNYKNAVVIGGGLLGLEAGNGLKIQGMNVTIVHTGKWLLNRQMDKTSGEMLQKELENRGLEFRLQGQTQALIGENGRVTGLKLASGEILPADIVVMSAGIIPNIELGKSAGLNCDRGIIVNDVLQTSDESIYAIGECVSHRGMTYGLVAPLFEMAKILAKHLTGQSAEYIGSVTSTKLKVTGIDLFSAGDFMGNETTEQILFHDASSGIYKKLVIQDDKLVGAVLYGDTVDGSYYFQLLKDQKPIHEIRNRLIFGQSHLGDTGHSGQNQVANMSDEAEICGCNGVCKGTIVKAITEKGLFTLDEVKKHTKASASCGSCTGLVEQVLAHTLGGDYNATPKTKSMCNCTDLTHEEVRAEIREKHYLTIPNAMKGMNWKTSNGCPTCRPALNYYLISTFPHEAYDDPQSRFINERVHANIQKDGTYSVVPRMYGGVTTSEQLRKIADVADKYQVPLVKVTGGQRIDLFGVKKEDLPKMWADLDMPSGYAYGKSIRTVKTCVGSEFCRFGTQDSTTMGIQLEKMLDHMWAPHKVKLAVSGCPRNCAESGIKDVGIIGVDSGWELYVGGNGGIKTEAGQFFCKVKTMDDVLEYSGAFLQLYREEARYLDRTVHWLERVGLDYAKSKVLDDAENRKALYERLLFSLQGIKEPWKLRTTGELRKEFELLSI